MTPISQTFKFVHFNFQYILTQSIKRYNDILIGLLYENECMYVFYVIMRYLQQLKIKIQNPPELTQLLLLGPIIIVNQYTDIKPLIDSATRYDTQMIALRHNNEIFRQFLQSDVFGFYKNDFFLIIFKQTRDQILQSSNITLMPTHKIIYCSGSTDSDFHIQQEYIF